MKFKVLTILIGLIVLPFQLYLWYLVLQRIGGTDLMWFIYWLLVPLSVILSIINKVAEWEED